MAETTFSPRLRTGVILSGAGTAGAYHAGVVRALLEAGIKIDVFAGHGAGVMTALAAAIDGGSRLWDPAGPWTDHRLRHAYRWRPGLRFAVFGLLIAAAVLLAPLLVLAFAAVIYAASVLAALVSLEGLSASLVAAYAGSIEWLFDPPILPTILPRALVLALLVIGAMLVVTAVQAARQERLRRRVRGAFWWRLLASPLSAAEPAATLIDALWKLVRGASHEPRPTAADIGRRYVDVLTDNFGQPGFHEVIVAVHDLDARRDLAGAVLSAPARAAFEARRAGAGLREAEIVDFTGPDRDLVVDFLLGLLQLPVVTAPHLAAFSAGSFWQGERHRFCDRPELLLRLVDELAGAGVEQVIVVTPAPPSAVPHGMGARPIEGRAKVGEFLRSVETAAVQDAAAAAKSRFSGVFVIRPPYNPIGPFDFTGVYDETSDRRRTVSELIQQGYVDAYRSFIEPVVAGN